MFDLGYFLGTLAAAFGAGIIGYLFTMPFTKSLKVRFGSGIFFIVLLGILPGLILGNFSILPGPIVALALFALRYKLAVRRQNTTIADAPN